MDLLELYRNNAHELKLRAGWNRDFVRRALDCRDCTTAIEQAPIPPVGLDPSRARILLIGRNPGFQELQEGLPFVGYSGRVMWNWLSEAGISLNDVTVTNLWPLYTKDDRLLTDHEVRHGKSHLKELIRYLPALDCIIVYGSQPNKAFGLTGSLSDVAGIRTSTSVEGLRYVWIPMVHPASTQYGDRFAIHAQRFIASVRAYLADRQEK